MARRERGITSKLRLIGCCGANCGTCRSFIRGQCRGCKIGYDDGTRSLGRTRCAVKQCCLSKGAMATCADCGDYPSCRCMLAFHLRKESKNRDYSWPVDYIRRHGYRKYLKAASRWKGPFGPLE